MSDKSSQAIGSRQSAVGSERHHHAHCSSTSARSASQPNETPGSETATANYETVAANCQLPAANSRRTWLIFLSLTVMFIVCMLWHPPDEPRVNLCAFKLLTGRPCPGCGMTRAFCALSHGEIWRAVRFNALSPVLFLAAIVGWARAATKLLKLETVSATLARLNPSPQVAKLLLLVVAVWWVVRLATGI